MALGVRVDLLTKSKTDGYPLCGTCVNRQYIIVVLTAIRLVAVNKEIRSTLKGPLSQG